MRIVITGANGFIGAWTVRAALPRGHKVWAITRPGADHRRLHGIQGRFVVAGVDPSDPCDIPGVLRDACPHAIINLAWPVPAGTYAHDEANLQGQALAMRWLAGARAFGVAHMVGVGTCMELGQTGAVRQEHDRSDPTSLYAATKDAVHQVSAQLCETGPTRFTWARLFHVFGAGGPRGWLVPDALNAFRQGRTFQATAGTQLRDWLHVSDVAEALVTLAEHPDNRVAHVCGGAVRPVAAQLRDLARLCGTTDLLQLGARPTPEHEPASIVGLPQTLHDLGWRPRLTPAQALAHTVEAFRSDTWLQGGPALPAPPRPVGLGDLTLEAAA